ncbi:MAG TPA: hypothetical protein PKC03_18055, partial [Dokdonella sp.]|nr:hypothetical protein [Dokdonella sp.]
ESRPLEKVATKNLDALKAYSLAVEASNTGDITQSDVLIGNAIDLDSGFARARIELASSQLLQGKRKEARAQLQAALALSDRLATRDKFMAEALLADFTSQRLALQKWKALANSYPDFFRAQGSYGFFAWTYANDFREAIAATRKNAVAQNPNSGTGHYLLGALLNGVGDYPEALKEFAESERLGIRYQNMYYASVFAAEREFEKMPEILARGRTSNTSADRLTTRIFQMSFAIDQGDWSGLRAMLANDDHQRPSLDPGQENMLRDAEVGASMLLGPDAQPVFRRDADGARGRAAAGADHDDDVFSANASLLFRALMASRASNGASTKALLAGLDPDSTNGDFPDLQKLRGLVDAQRALSGADAATAAAKLKTLVDGTELNVTHLLLMEALAGAGDLAGAREQARWLAAQRGRAYAQVSANMAFMPFDVAQSNLALLYDAEYSMKLEESQSARDRLAEFLQRWPVEKSPEWIKTRVSRLELELGSSQPKDSAPKI